MAEHLHIHPPEDGMMSVEEARTRILDHVQLLPDEEQSLLQALGQVLAEDIHAPFDVPPMDNSAMDGYALLAHDIRGAASHNPILLRVTGHVAAGHPGDLRVEPGSAVRIMTGAPVPPGADTVVPFEETDELEQRARGIPGSRIQEIRIKVEMPREPTSGPPERTFEKATSSLPPAPF